MTNITELRTLLDTITIYRKASEADAIELFKNMVDSVSQKTDFNDVAYFYSSFVDCLYNFENRGSLSDYISKLVIYDENYFSLSCAKGLYNKLDSCIKDAALSDIKVFETLASLKCIDLKDFIKSAYSERASIVDKFASYTTKVTEFDIWDFVDAYKANSIGIFARFGAFKFNSNSQLEPIENCDKVTFADLKHYKSEQETVRENTLAFLKGKPYNNVLLYGDRGTGKSSTVKALLNEYKDDGLRIIQVYKENLVHLDALMTATSDIPLKFIVFIDDLTFNENDDNFGALKAVLEGSVAKQPQNMAIYATTNRRHLVRESFSARAGDEIHLSDTLDETISLSDRFGILVTYSIPNKDKFLEIVKEIKEDRKLVIADSALFMGAERFALLKGNRSPRLAKQYIDDLQSRLELNLQV